MKNITLAICFLLTAQLFCQEQEDKKIYLAVNLHTGLPMYEFKTNYDKKVFWMVSMDLFFRPFQKKNIWEPGLQFEGVLTEKTKYNNWNGLNISTSSSFIRLNQLNRFRLSNSGNFTPFIETSTGLQFSITQSSYKIVNEASFIEKFLFNAEDEIEQNVVQDYISTSLNTAFGIGFLYKKLLTFQIKYNFSPSIEYITNDNIMVNEGNIEYIPRKSELHMFVICLGISLETIEPVNYIED